MELKTISDTFNKMYVAKAAYLAAAETAINCRVALERERLAKLASGEIAGKNADEREAKAREILTGLYEKLDDAECKERKAHGELELVQIEAECTKLLLRAEELAAA